MAKKPLPTPDELRQLLRYEPDTGKLFWKERPPESFKSDGHNGSLSSSSAWNTRYAGKEAFTSKSHGYLSGSLYKRLTRAHRVAWAITHGEWPCGEIDHINGDRSDNRLINLREVTSQENKQNARRRADNTSGVVGVSRCRDSDRWRARIFLAGSELHLGRFGSFEAAVKARKAAEIEFGFHHNHGR